MLCSLLQRLAHSHSCSSQSLTSSLLSGGISEMTVFRWICHVGPTTGCHVNVTGLT